ncbi:MAG TPA: GNAT family N-acetyltransferase [Gemmatimonadaceae bacterium]
MRSALRLAALDASHRARVAEILRACDVFRENEVDVALELFDEASGVPSAERRAPSAALAAAAADYAFLGLFAEHDRLVAFSCHGPTPGTDRTYDLYWIAVDPALQGAGGGSALLADVERMLADDGARMLVVETSSRPEYVGTRAFYSRRGYVEAARVRAFYAPDDDRVIFTKRLPGPTAGTEQQP